MMAYGGRRIILSLKYSLHGTYFVFTSLHYAKPFQHIILIWKRILSLNVKLGCLHFCLFFFSCSFSCKPISVPAVAPQAQPGVDSQNEDDHLLPGWSDRPRGLLHLYLWHLLHLSAGSWHDTPCHTAGTPCLQTGVSGGRWSQSRQSLWHVQGPLLKVGKLLLSSCALLITHE